MSSCLVASGVSSKRAARENRQGPGVEDRVRWSSRIYPEQCPISRGHAAVAERRDNVAPIVSTGSGRNRSLRLACPIATGIDEAKNRRARRSPCWVAVSSANELQAVGWRSLKHPAAETPVFRSTTQRNPLATTQKWHISTAFARATFACRPRHRPRRAHQEMRGRS